jgi:hypothetical protein
MLFLLGLVAMCQCGCIKCKRVTEVEVEKPDPVQVLAEMIKDSDDSEDEKSEEIERELPVNRLKQLIEEGIRTNKINYSDLTSINAATIEYLNQTQKQQSLEHSQL